MEIIKRLKTVAKQKAEETKKGIEKEKSYQRYKHPTLSYIQTGETTTDYKHSKEFGERLEKERENTAKKKVKRAEQRTAIKNVIKTKLKEMKTESKKQRKQPKQQKRKDVDIFGFGSTNKNDSLGFDVGQGFDLGMGKKKGKRFSIW